MPETTIKQWYIRATEKLISKSNSPDLDARCIIAHALGVNSEHVFIYPENKIDDTMYMQLETLLEKRVNGIPIAYITHSKEFFGRNFYIDERVLVPRPETELVVEKCLSYISTAHSKKNKVQSPPVIIADICTGSGCIAISLSCELASLDIPHHVYATDTSTDALAVARINASSHHVEKNISYIKGDLLLPLMHENICPEYIVSNPPYVSEEEYIKSSSIAHEPKEALVSSEGGTAHLTRIIEQLKSFPDSHAFIEIGSLHGKYTLDKSAEYNLNSTIHKDFAGLDRYAEIIKRQTLFI
jgi:release factor glutamine methyltransferase